MKRLIYILIAVFSMTTVANAEPASVIGSENAEVATGLSKKEQKKAEKQRKKEEKERKKAKKEEEKRLKKARKEYMDSVEYSILRNAIDDMHFVIVADRLRFRRGGTANVNSTTNFILVQGDKATVQLAFEHGFSGLNGLGGITVEGNITNVKKQFDKKGNLVFSMMVSGTAISADVAFTLPKDGSSCDATVTSTFYRPRITFSGRLRPYSQDVITGRRIP